MGTQDKRKRKSPNHVISHTHSTERRMCASQIVITGLRRAKKNMEASLITNKSKTSAVNSATSQAVATVDIYTDGSCIDNPGAGGCSAILIYKGVAKEIIGGYRKTTNNRMEIMAAIIALQALKRPCNVNLHSDSQYLVNTMTKGWRRNINNDLWEKLDSLCSSHKVNFIWVKGHTGNKHNERCDQLALSAARNATMVDDAYESAQK